MDQVHYIILQNNSFSFEPADKLPYLSELTKL